LIVRYRRANTPGATYFFAIVLADRRSTLLVDRVDALREAVAAVKSRHPFTIDAFVVLPNHVHAIWTLPDHDADFSTRWMLIKQAFARAIPKVETISPSRSRKGERGIWQRRFWEHQIRDELDFERHVDYVHFNPVKHGYTARPIDWPHSSIHRFVRDGLISKEWGAGVAFEDGGFGER
jgi:putative transposase